jgi:hypothetical protein
MQKAILIAANPYKNYEISPAHLSKEPGDVELHWTHLRQHKGVFWDVIPQGRADKPWPYHDLRTGYFYIARDKTARYSIEIEFIKRWRDIDLVKFQSYIPQCRMTYLQAYPERSMNYYAILIRDIRRLTPEHRKEELQLANFPKQVDQVRNYAFIIDPLWR